MVNAVVTNPYVNNCYVGLQNPSHLDSQAHGRVKIRESVGIHLTSEFKYVRLPPSQ